MAIKSKLNVGIIGSGKVGTDLLIKVLKSDYMDCGLFVGRNLQSEGMQKAMSLGVIVSDQSIDAFKLSRDTFDLVFDATTAEHHRSHAEYFRRANIKAIDLTPAKVGRYCVPTIDADVVTNEQNINMVTCGGQASIPVIHTLSKVYPHIHQVNVQSRVAEDSIGPGTLANIDDYYSSTASAISAYSCIQNVNVDLQVEKSVWKPDMLTIIRAYTNETDLNKLYEPLQQRLAQVRKKVPGYNIVGTPIYKDGAVEVVISVRGQGDWVPAHAGNLDIINCAALAIAERYAQHLGVRPELVEAEHAGALGSLLGMFGKGTKGMPETA
ncbi:acetaldehyde dehydrogenase [Alteromonadaceae bacterium Bs31]|nr:acetaldehyde dehydrogenase [Alteromonadaceae bacterium Bs31]